MFGKTHKSAPGARTMRRLAVIVLLSALVAGCEAPPAKPRVLRPIPLSTCSISRDKTLYADKLVSVNGIVVTAPSGALYLYEAQCPTEPVRIDWPRGRIRHGVEVVEAALADPLLKQGPGLDLYADLTGMVRVIDGARYVAVSAATDVRTMDKAPADPVDVPVCDLANYKGPTRLYDKKTLRISGRITTQADYGGAYAHGACGGFVKLYWLAGEGRNGVDRFERLIDRTDPGQAVSGRFTGVANYELGSGYTLTLTAVDRLVDGRRDFGYLEAPPPRTEPFELDSMSDGESQP